MAGLREIGFWSSDADSATPDRPLPTLLVDDAWFAAVAADDSTLLHRLQWYLTRGAFVESHELAYSFCRFLDCAAAAKDPSVMGACTMTDGVYCWPEALWHYVNVHHVKPSDEFLWHMEANYDRMQQVAAAHESAQCLLLWNECEHQAAPMPRAMQEWITTYTTLTVVDTNK